MTFAKSLFERSQQLSHDTQKEIAEHIGVAQTTVGRWLDGSTVPMGRNIVTAAEYLETDIADLVTMLAKETEGPPTTTQRLATLESEIRELRDLVATHLDRHP